MFGVGGIWFFVGWVGYFWAIWICVIGILHNNLEVVTA